MSEWISVNDRLPNHLQKILFCFKNGTGYGDWYKYPTTMIFGDFFRFSPTEATFRNDMRPVKNESVAWWMPIPNDPSEQLP